MDALNPQSWHILHLLNSASWGGLEIYVSQLIDQLQRKGIRQTILCPEGSRILDQSFLKNIDVYSYPNHLIRSKLGLSLYLLRHFSLSPPLTHIHSHTRVDLWAVRLASTVMVRARLPHLFSLYMNAPAKRDPLHRWIFSGVDAVTTSSSRLVDEIGKNWAISPEKVHFLPYGRDPLVFPTFHSNQVEMRSSERIIFGTMARIEEKKGVLDLARAILEVPQSLRSHFEVWILGDPTLKHRRSNGEQVHESQSLKVYEELRKIQRLCPELRLIPFQKDYFPYLEAMDVFVMPAHDETYSLSVIDAMIRGKPIIGARAGGTIEQVGERQSSELEPRGLLFTPGNCKALGEALIHYIENPQVIHLHGQNAKRWALNRHQWDQTLQKLLDLYSKLYTQKLKQGGAVSGSI